MLDPDGSCVMLPAQGFMPLRSCRYLVNPGSVGMPRSEDFRATYCVYDTDANSVMFRRVSYDVQAFRKSIEKMAKSSEQVAYVLELLDSHLSPVRKNRKILAAGPARARREAAMAAIKARKAKKLAGRPHAGKSMYLSLEDLNSVQDADSSPEQKSSRDASPPKRPGAVLISLAVSAVIVLAMGLYSCSRKGSSNGVAGLPQGGASTSPVAVPRQAGIVRSAVRFENLVLAHRWSFNNSLADSVGGSDAKIVKMGANGVTLETNRVVLAGGDRNQSGYVQLGCRLLADRTTPVTIELWATPISVKKWSRIFDFGSSISNSLMMTWSVDMDSKKDRVSWLSPVARVDVDASNQAFVPGTEFHVVMVVVPGTGVGGTTHVSWYSAPSRSSMIGTVHGSFDTRCTIETMDDACDNLGRSFFSNVETANAGYNEVRFWDGAASWMVAEKLHEAGPDAVFK